MSYFIFNSGYDPQGRLRAEYRDWVRPAPLNYYHDGASTTIGLKVIKACVA